MEGTTGALDLESVFISVTHLIAGATGATATAEAGSEHIHGDAACLPENPKRHEVVTIDGQAGQGTENSFSSQFRQRMEIGEAKALLCSREACMWNEDEHYTWNWEMDGAVDTTTTTTPAKSAQPVDLTELGIALVASAHKKKSPNSHVTDIQTKEPPARLLLLCAMMGLPELEWLWLKSGRHWIS